MVQSQAAQPSTDPAAETRAAQARLTHAEAAVRTIEDNPPGTAGALANARLERSDAAEAFRRSARAWTAAAPSDAAAQAALAAADHAAKEYFMPRGVY